MPERAPDNRQYVDPVVITAATAQAIDLALSKQIAQAIAHYSREPYPDDPRWTPWTRFGHPLAKRCDEARKALRRESGYDRAP